MSYYFLTNLKFNRIPGPFNNCMYFRFEYFTYNLFNGLKISALIDIEKSLRMNKYTATAYYSFKI